MDRDKIIIKTSFLGILVNIILVIFKATIGAIVNSIAIILDAVNNFSYSSKKRYDNRRNTHFNS